MVERLARFAARASYDMLSADAAAQLKVRVLDSLACALGARDAGPVRRVREHVRALDKGGPCSLIGGGTAAPHHAALHNGVLVRYLDYNDSYLAPGETCHPSDNLAPVLAACEAAEARGDRFLTALAVAYQVQCRLSDEAPVRARGFDHTTQLACSAAAGAAKGLGLDEERTAHAVAIATTALAALRVTRTGALSQWKGLAAPHAGFGALHAALLAARGITGPREVFEGNKGFMESLSGRFRLDWDNEDLERVRRTVVKKHNAEVHSQTAIEAALDLKREHALEGRDIARVEVATFDVAHAIIGGGEEGDKTRVRTKEEADHSLPYMVAAALLDGGLGPAQYEEARILSDDVQELLSKVVVRPLEEYSRRFPREMPSRVIVRLRDGRAVSKERVDYEGFTSRPMPWEGAVGKLRRLAPADSPVLDELVETVASLEARPVTGLCRLLSPRPSAASARAEARP